MDALTLLQDNWAILMSIIWLIWSYANLKGHVWQLHTRFLTHEIEDKEKWVANTDEHKRIDKKVEDMQPVWHEIRERLVKIETILFNMQDKSTNRK